MQACYDYQCRVCGAHFEHRRPYEARDIEVPCPREACDGLCRRIWVGRAPGIAFKGPGWDCVGRFNQEQAKIKAEADREWKDHHETNWYRDMEKAINNSRPMTDDEAARADRAAFEFAKTGATSGTY